LAIRLSSFPWVPSRFVPRGNPCKLAALCAVVALTGCGGGGKQQDAAQVVRGTGYRFQAPAGWAIVRSGRQVQAAEGGKSPALIAVSRFPLLRRAADELSPKVIEELDRVAEGVASQQHGTVSAKATTEVAGRQARRYDVDYESRGKKLVERLGFVLRGKTEYLLLCRFERDGDTSPCDELVRTFTLA
jgi:hypothetical protein